MKNRLKRLVMPYTKDYNTLGSIRFQLTEQNSNLVENNATSLGFLNGSELLIEMQQEGFSNVIMIDENVKYILMEVEHRTPKSGLLIEIGLKELFGQWCFTQLTRHP